MRSETNMNYIKRIKEWKSEGTKQYNGLSQDDKDTINFLSSWSQIFLIIGMILVAYSYKTLDDLFFFLGTICILIELILAISIKNFVKKKMKGGK